METTTTLFTAFGLFIVIACAFAWVALLVSDYLEHKRNKKFAHVNFYDGLKAFNEDSRNNNLSDL